MASIEKQITELAAMKAGNHAIKYFGELKNEHISQKDEFDFVTEVDKTCEKIIRQEIQNAFPFDNILGEEEGGKFEVDKRTWIIDPLDGTLNFIHGFPLFAISIGLVSEKKELLSGSVYLPTQKELFSAEKGKGATLNGYPIEVSKNNEPKERLLATGFPYKDAKMIEKGTMMLQEILKKTSGVRMPGCAAVHLAFVACGRLDGFWEHNINAWDIAAGALLVEEAGGKVTDYFGEHKFLERRQIVATNKKLHTWLQQNAKNYLT